MGAPQTSIHFICFSVNAQRFDSMSKLFTSQILKKLYQVIWSIKGIMQQIFM